MDWFAGCGQWNERSVDHVAFGKFSGELEGKPSLSDTARAYQGNQPGGGIAQPLLQYLQVGIPPDQRGDGERQRGTGSPIDGIVMGRCAGTCDESVARDAVQVQRGGQCPHGLDVGSPALPPFERADGMDRQPRNCRELFLRKPGVLTELLELRSKGRRSARFHGWLLPILRAEAGRGADS